MDAVRGRLTALAGVSHRGLTVHGPFILQCSNYLL